MWTFKLFHQRIQMNKGVFLSTSQTIISGVWKNPYSKENTNKFAESFCQSTCDFIIIGADQNLMYFCMWKTEQINSSIWHTVQLWKCCSNAMSPSIICKRGPFDWDEWVWSINALSYADCYRNQTPQSAKEKYYYKWNYEIE